MIEQSLKTNNEISGKYKLLVAEADMMRMLYASHHMKRRDAVLPVIQKKLLTLMKNEEELLTKLVEKSTKVLNNETMEFCINIILIIHIISPLKSIYFQ